MKGFDWFQQNQLLIKRRVCDTFVPINCSALVLATVFLGGVDFFKSIKKLDLVYGIIFIEIFHSKMNSVNCLILLVSLLLREYFHFRI